MSLTDVYLAVLTRCVPLIQQRSSNFSDWQYVPEKSGMGGRVAKVMVNIVQTVRKLTLRYLLAASGVATLTRAIVGLERTRGADDDKSDPISETEKLAPRMTDIEWAGSATLNRGGEQG